MFFNHKVHKGLHKALKVVVIFIKNLSRKAFSDMEKAFLFWLNLSRKNHHPGFCCSRRVELASSSDCGMGQRKSRFA